MDIKYDYKIRFESVTVGAKSVHTFVIPNKTQNTDWTIIKYPDFNGSLNAFTVRKKVSRYLNKYKNEVLINYKPVQPDQTHINYYLIKNIGKNDIILCVTGSCIGLSVQASVKYINFYKLKNDFKTKSVFELQNHSTCKICFQFDIDNNQDIFNIDPEMGEIAPGKYVYITVQFITEKTGIFFMDLPCLIIFHQPIYIELFGINSPTGVEKHFKQLKGQCCRLSLENGFAKYMNNTFGSYNSNPICNITPKNFDFCLKTSKISFFTEILNYTDKCLKIIWDTDVEKGFSVNPDKSYIRPNERNSVEMKFLPKGLEKFYGGEIYGRVFIFGGTKIQEDPGTVIAPISIRFIGNTFVRTTKWIPTAEISPKTVQMPVCLRKGVFSTFLIKRFGSYPVAFKCLPPFKTNFEVKPMVGYITNSFQIFVVKFFCGDVNTGTFNEHWKIQLNQNETEHLEINFKATVQEPKLIINGNDQLHFGTVFPGCKQFLKVPLINPTQNTLKFVFKNNKWICVKPLQDIIEGFGVIELEFCYTADCDVEDKIKLTYEMRLVQENILILGEPYVGSVEIFAKCAYGALCSSPSKFDFETVVCGIPTSTIFTLFNFSEVDLHFSLTVHEHYGFGKHNTVSTDPSRGSVPPGGNLDITVTVLTYWSCLNTYCIQFFLRESEFSDVPIEPIGKTFLTSGTIFRVDYYSFYPTLKFMEVGLNTTGPLFGKQNVWEYFNMDSLNEILRTLRQGETKKHFMRLPDAEAGLEITKNITLIVKNVTRENTTCRFERKKNCTCELQEVKNTNSTFRKFSYDDCPHRKILSITTTEDIIKAYSIMFLTIQINYILPDEQEVCFLMQLSHNRTIELIFQVVGLKSAQLSTYCNGFTLKMNTVYIGELRPDLQIYWFLNNTRATAFYKVDVEPLKVYNAKWGHPILTCLNPEGYCDEKSLHYIEFLFEPIASGTVNIELPFQFGIKNATLNIVGLAKPYFISPLEGFYWTELGREGFKINDLLVNISTEHIVVRAIPTHCATSRILTLRNVSAGSSIGFTFDSYDLEGIFKAQIRPASGVLAPNERVALVLRMETGGVACALRITVSCHLVDNTVLQRHLNTTTEYYRQTDIRNDQFCIENDGTITYPEIPMVEVTPSPKVFHRTVAITCHIIPQIDLDTKMTIQDQMKQTPFKALSIYQPNLIKNFLIPRPRPFESVAIRPIVVKKVSKPLPEKCYNKCCFAFKEREYEAVHTVLSCLLRDIVFSKDFKYRVNAFKHHTNRYYSEMKTLGLSMAEEKRMVQLVVNKIPSAFLSETLQIILADCVLKRFKIGQYPFDFTDCEQEIKLTRQLSTYGKSRYTENFLFLLEDNVLNL